jgi:RNA polymerase sigma-70 factor (ECF subfamily)
MTALPKAQPERTAEESDESLMQRYCDGEGRAFDALFARHGRRVHAFLVRHVRDRARADDLLQATWLNVHRARATFERGGRFLPWLYTIANNARRDDGRRSGRDPGNLTRDGELPEPSAPLPAASDDTERVQAALATIPESYREVIVLHRWHDLGFSEIARMLDTTEGAVKLRAHRGYLALRTLLAKESL